MGSRAEDAVGADEVQAVGGDLAHRLVRGVVLDHRHVERRLDEQREDRLSADPMPRSSATAVSVFPTAASFGGAAFAITIRSGPSVAKVFSQPGTPCCMSCAIRSRSAGSCSRSRVAEAPPSCAQAGQQRREDRRAGAVRVLVEGEVDVGARAVEELEQRIDERLVGERLQVREVQRRARAARDLDELADRLEHLVALVAHVGDERRAERRGLLGQRDELVGVGVGAGQVDHPE